MKSDAEFPLFRAEQVRAIDRAAIRSGVAGIVLMKRAGQAAFAQLGRYWPQARSITVFCGAGNNAGDGYIIARLAHEAGLDVELVALVAPEALKGDARRAAEWARQCDLSIRDYDPTVELNGEVIVDALLGTGLDRAVTGVWAEAIAAINTIATPVLAVDIPSGLHADTGQVMGCAVQADVTVSFIARKQGLYTADGPDRSGHIVFDALAVPDAIQDAIVSQFPPVSWLYPVSLPYLPARRLNSHKGDYGHVLVLGGSTGMEGAAHMAGAAALRSGCGLVSIAAGSEERAMVASGMPELMIQSRPDQVALAALILRSDVLALGPGLGAKGQQDEWIQHSLQAALAAAKPMVLDADALNYLAQHPVALERAVITPHPGEAARLLQCSIADIQADRFAAAEALQQRYQAIVVLKGCGTIVCDAERIRVVPTGHPGMATAGMGDILTGVIAAMLAQYPQASMTLNVLRAVVLHGQAGQRAARQGAAGLVATDLLPLIREYADGQ